MSIAIAANAPTPPTTIGIKSPVPRVSLKSINDKQ